MAKNMIRKSVALGAGFALASAGMVALPAQAAGEIKLESAVGGEIYKVVHNGEFVLKASITAGNSTDELEFLKYSITSGGAFEVDAGAADTAALARAAVADAAVAVGTAEADVAGAWADGDAAAQFLAISLDKLANDTDFAITDASKSVTVVAYIDKDGDSTADADEWQASKTVTFADSDTVNLQTTLTTTRGAAPKAVVTSTDLNLGQMQGSAANGGLDVKFTSSANGDNNETQLAASATYDSDDNDITYTTDDAEPDGGAAGSGVAVAAVGETYTARAEIGTTAFGNTSTRTVAAATIDEVEYTIAATATNAALADNGADVSAKAGSGSFEIKIVTELANAAVKDSDVEVKIEENAATSLDSGASVTFLGQTLTNTADASVQNKKASVTTDSSAKSTIAVSYSGTKKDDKIKVTLTGDGNAPSFTVTFADAAATTVHNTDVIGTAAELVKGADSDITLNYALLDQFGALFTGSGHSVQVNDDADAAKFTGNFVNGRASVTIPGYDAGDTPGTIDAAVLKDQAAVGGVTTTTELTIGSPEAVSSITIAGNYGTAAAPLTLSTKAFSNADVRIAQSAPSVEQEITNVVITLKDANGNATTGDVTVSGDGLLFAMSDLVYKSGSATIKTQASGATAAAQLEISSNTTGKKTLTVTAGGVTKTQDIYFGDAAAQSGASVVIDAPDFVDAGTTFSFTTTVLDAFGNGVDSDQNAANAAGAAAVDATDATYKIEYSGAGLTVGTTPSEVKESAKGGDKFSVLLGSNDTSGTITITVSYDQNGDKDFTDAKDLVVTKTITIGEAPVTQKVNAGSFKGYVAVYARGYEGQRLSAKIGNDWVIVDPIVNNQGSDLHRTTDFTGAGVDIAVRIYIDRVLIDTINLTTK